MAYFVNLLSLFVLTTTLMLFFFSPSHSISPSPPVNPPFPPVKPQKVDLVVYYKTLSPRCADFIVNYLKLVFQTDLNTIVNLRLVPWVNAKVINGTIYCWQGEALECYLNFIEACVIKAYPEVKTHFPLISCIEAENSTLMQVKRSQDVENFWRKCAHNLGFPHEPIDKCFNSGEVIKVIYHIIYAVQ
ncbi:hypothetical protein EZV62_016708 [Acer yangbiense]|uniref:Prolamin-like domain-containing protein n=1 Tax=Acer yangbiense TaxID=1000413 RepID=A0A5C7HPX0_9ROSI|nr:hypothetical protein EZV62_016708 [Acer yangbiense]